MSNEFIAPGVLLIPLVTGGVYFLLKKVFPSAQHLVITMLMGILFGPSILSDFIPEIHDFLFPNGTSGVKFLSDVAVVIMGLIAGMHIAASGHHSHGEESVVEDDIQRAIFKGRRVAIVSGVSITVQVVLGLAVSFIIPLVAPDAVGNRTLLPWALAVIFPVIALPVLTAALMGIGLVQKKVGRASMQLSVNSEIYLWPALIALTAYANATGTSHGESEHSVSLTTLIGGVVVYGAAMLIVRIGWSFIDRHAPLVVSLGVGIAIVYGSVMTTEHLGLHTLLGAVVAGLIAPRSVIDFVTTKEHIVKYGLTPYFLYGVGLFVAFEFGNIQVWTVAVLLTVVSGTVQIIVISQLAHRMLHFFPHKAMAIGSLSIMRGMVEIVISRQLATAGIISPILSQGVILMAVIQTVVGPLMARWQLDRADRTGENADDELAELVLVQEVDREAERLEQEQLDPDLD